MGAAFEAALKAAGLQDRTDPLAELIAHKIIQVYRLGEHDPDQLCEGALHELGVPRSILFEPGLSSQRAASKHDPTA